MFCARSKKKITQRRDDQAREQKTENIFWRKTPLLLIKASGQSNLKQHLSLFFLHLCILHSHLFLTPFSATYTKNIFIIFGVALCIERRRLFGGMLSRIKMVQFGTF